MLLNRNFFLLIILFLIGSTTYWNSLDNSYHLDDGNRLVDNQAIRKVAPVSRHFFDPSTNSNLPDLVQYRPLMPLSFSLNYYFSELNIKGYRISNFVALWICSALAFYLVLLLLDIAEPKIKSSVKKSIAFFTALIFLIHPISGITVNYISARDILLMELFFLLALIFHIKTYQKNKTSITYRILSYFFLVCSLLAKKNSLVFPFVILSYDLIIARKTKAAFRNFIINSAICVVFLFTIKYVLDFSDFANTQSYSSDSFSYAISQTKVHLYYLFCYFNPFVLRPYPELNLPHSLLDIGAIFGLLVIFGSLFFAIYIRKNHSLISWCIVSYWLLLAPTSSIYPLIHESVPYRPFPSILFLSLILVFLVTKIFKPKKALMSLLILSSILLATSIQTNKIWKNQYTLWTNTLMRGGGC